MDLSAVKWVDLQVNGHNGVDYSSPTLTMEQVARSAEELYHAGTEVFLPTLVTRSDELYRRNIPLIKAAVEKYHLEKQIPGIHLEGPMITSKGSHDPAWIQACTPENVEKLYDLSEGFIRILTLSADAPGAVDAVAAACERGMIPSVGHHMAGYGAVHQAADAGCRLLTHLGNACPNLVGRHENPLLAGLAEDRMIAMIITDGHHLPGDLVKLICKVKGADGIIVTSDACEACGYPPGNYELWGNHAVLEPCGRLYNPEKQCLVASVATMADCMKFLDSLQIFTDDELLQVGRTNALKLLKLI